MKIGDEVTMCGVIVEMSENHNPIVQIKGCGKFLIKRDAIKTVRPPIEVPEKDMRKGK